MAKVIKNRLKTPKGKLIREALNHVYDSVVEAYGEEILLDPSDITSPQKTVDQEIVDLYVKNPGREADVAAGRSGNRVLAVQRDGQIALVDGNHRVVAALEAGRKIKVLVVNMDQAFADAELLDKSSGIGKRLMDAAKSRMAGKLNPEDIATRHQVHLERLKAGIASDYMAKIRKIDKSIQGLLNGLEVEKLRDLTQKQLTALLRELRDAQVPLYAEALDDVANTLADLAESEAEFEANVIASLSGVKAVEASTPYLAALKSPITATGDLLEPFLKDLSARQVKRIEKEIMKSIASGRTISQTVQAVRGTKARNYQDGVLQQNWNDARSVIRTATQHVSQVSRHATWIENDIKKYQVVATLDSKTSDKCKGLDGKVFVVGEGPEPPYHPQCRTTTVPYFPPSVWDEGATRSAANGPVDANETYYSWLKKQPVAFQNDALGPVRAKLLRNGGLTAEEFRDLSLDRNFEPLTLDEMKRLNPNAFEKAKI